MFTLSDAQRVAGLTRINFLVRGITMEVTRRRNNASADAVGTAAGNYVGPPFPCGVCRGIRRLVQGEKTLSFKKKSKPQ